MRPRAVWAELCCAEGLHDHTVVYDVSMMCVIPFHGREHVRQGSIRNSIGLCKFFEVIVLFSLLWRDFESM